MESPEICAAPQIPAKSRHEHRRHAAGRIRANPYRMEQAIAPGGGSRRPTRGDCAMTAHQPQMAKMASKNVNVNRNRRPAPSRTSRAPQESQKGPGLRQTDHATSIKKCRREQAPTEQPYAPDHSGNCEGWNVRWNGNRRKLERPWPMPNPSLRTIAAKPVDRLG